MVYEMRIYTILGILLLVPAAAEIAPTMQGRLTPMQGRLTPCLQARLDAPPRIGVYVPQCLDDGRWSPVQCWGSVGTCWCVDEQGAKTGQPLEVCRNALTDTEGRGST